jgi:hypothetical protein
VIIVQTDPSVKQDGISKIAKAKRDGGIDVTGRGLEEKQIGCVLIMRQREGMAKQRDKT